MSQEFELRKDISLDASPEQVWNAIATGPGVDSWFMGRSEIEPLQGGAASLTVAGQANHSTVTAWDPGRRLVLRVGGDDHPPMAINYLIEGREGSTTVLRLVQSGVLGDDWETEFEAMNSGWDLYLHTLSEYLTHFPGQHAWPVTVTRPNAGDRTTVWRLLTSLLGLGHACRVGAPAHVHVADLGETMGIVDYADDPGILGLRSTDGLYRFMHTGPERGNVLFLSHHLFGTIDGKLAERAWRAWLDSLVDESSVAPPHGATH